MPLTYTDDPDLPEADRSADTPPRHTPDAPWPDDDPPPALPPMDPEYTWSMEVLEALDARRAWMERQAARERR